MSIKGCIAMILAGGRGEGLGALTRYYSKPAVHFGSKYRIIDFTIRNCLNSGVDTIGILSQYLSDDLHAYITRDGAVENSGIFMLPPKRSYDYYRGTADAVYKNVDFIDRFEPEDVLILSGDHIYNMDYNEMLDFHRETGANITIASTQVPINEAKRFGIINAEENGRVCGFEEKPLRPKSCLASMGIYVFKWSVLKQYLFMDSVGVLTRHDFGADVVPKMLREGKSVYTYQFDGYWRDVGTVDSLWEANMDQISEQSASPCTGNMPYYIAHDAVVQQSIVSDGCTIAGDVEHSVLGDRVTVDKGAEIVDSVIMPGAHIGCNAKVYKAVVGTNAVIMDNTVIGSEDGSDFFIDRKVCARDVSLVSPWLYIGENMSFQEGSHIYEGRLKKWDGSAKIAEEPYHNPISSGRYDYSVRQALLVYHYPGEKAKYDFNRSYAARAAED